MSIRLKLLSGVFLILAASAIGAVWYIYDYLYRQRQVAEVFVEIPQGAGYSQVLDDLAAKGIAPWRLGNRLALRLAGGPKALKAGVYRFSGTVSVAKAFEDFARGRVDLVSVTFPEGMTAREMAAVLGASGVTDGAKFAEMAYATDSAVKYGLAGPTLEGYLFPDTYKFARKIPPQAVMDVMIARFKAVAAEVSPALRAGSLDLAGWVTLASIVEKETGRASERPIIASVFLNRLRIGMKLQTDPTVIYGIRNFDGNIRKADLLRDTPYNTYTRSGLPPGPIANPGRGSLEAVLRPANSEFLYFVSKNDGSHYFSRTLGEHNQAVGRYQLSKR